MGRRLFWLALVVVMTGALVAESEVTFESLLREMTDLEGLTRLPDPAHTCKQFSSYDRRATDPAVSTVDNWFANSDRGQHLREESQDGAAEWVMMDVSEPGAIVRIWSANPRGAGIVRVYLDGAADPVIERPFPEFLEGGPLPFIEPISGMRGRGCNSYLPIPYAKHCKVTASQRNFYYHINYRTYGDEIDIETYTPDLVRKHSALIEETAKRLSEPERFAAVQGGSPMAIQKTIEPDETFTRALEGQAAIYRIACKMTGDDLEAALRTCVMELRFDGDPTPAVRAPLGDFFGTAPGANAYRSLPSGVLDDGTLYSHWIMPFAESAVLKLTNKGEAPLTIDGELVVGPYGWRDDSLHFHAGWRAEYPIPTRPQRDWSFLECRGQGRYVGSMLHVTNPMTNWWGEGDEKIYVDGEDFPSHFGTGTEDYYGYAWCATELFTHAYHNQAKCDGPGNYGHTCVSRFHIADNIPFAESFKFDMEVWHWRECEVALAATSYWYARPGCTDFFSPLKAADLRIVTPAPLEGLMVVKSALEGEKLSVMSSSGGRTNPQRSDTMPWSFGYQLCWMEASPKDTLVLGFPAPEPGRYEVLAVFTKGDSYGTMQLAVNDGPAGSPIDFYHPESIVTERQSLGQYDLQGKGNKLTVTVIGRNKKTLLPRHTFGLDYLLLNPVD